MLLYFVYLWSFSWEWRNFSLLAPHTISKPRPEHAPKINEDTKETRPFVCSILMYRAFLAGVFIARGGAPETEGGWSDSW